MAQERSGEILSVMVANVRLAYAIVHRISPSIRLGPAVLAQGMPRRECALVEMTRQVMRAFGSHR